METYEKIKIILKKIRFSSSSHNEIYLSHLKKFLVILIEDENQDWKSIKYKSSMSAGIGERYIKQYFKGLVAWKICDLDENDRLVWNIKFEDETDGGKKI